MKYSRKGGELQPTHFNVNSGGKPSTPHLASSASGYLATSSLTLGVETALGALWRQVLLRLASSAPENLSAKCTSCSFNTSTVEFMFEFTSPRKLGLVNSEHELRCTWSWVGEVLPLFRRTSSKVRIQKPTVKIIMILLWCDILCLLGVVNVENGCSVQYSLY